jgi:hypothetical protein
LTENDQVEPARRARLYFVGDFVAQPVLTCFLRIAQRKF